jgi:hypothetical protein
MNQSFLLGLLFLCSALLSGCVSTSIERYSDIPYEQNKDVKSLSIVDLRNTERPFEVIGYVQIKASEVYTPLQIMKKIDSIAKKMGGDAVSDLSQTILPKKFPHFFDYLNFYHSRWSAEIIVWQDA